MSFEERLAKLANKAISHRQALNDIRAELDELDIEAEENFKAGSPQRQVWYYLSNALSDALEGFNIYDIRAIHDQLLELKEMRK